MCLIFYIKDQHYHAFCFPVVGAHPQQDYDAYTLLGKYCRWSSDPWSNH